MNTLNNKNDLLKWYISTRIQESVSGKNGTPIAFSFLLTNRCMLRCKHCFYHKTIDQKKDDELTFDDYVRLSNNLDSFVYGFFCGGEPFIREDLADIIDLFQKNNNVVWSNMTTNGQLTDKVVSGVRKIISNRDKFFNLNISFEGPEEINDQIRGKGSFKRAIETFKECSKLRKEFPNFRLGITTTMCSVNQDHLTPFFKWLHKELHPNQINCLLIRQNPRGGEHLKDVSIDKYKAITDTLVKIRKEINPDEENIFYHQLSVMNKLVYDTHILNKRQFTCFAGVQGAFIDYDGTVNVCEVFCDSSLNSSDSHTMGNLKDFDMNFKELWNSPVAQRIKNEVNTNDVCLKCTHETEGLAPSLFIAPNILADYLINK